VCNHRESKRLNSHSWLDILEGCYAYNVVNDRNRHRYIFSLPGHKMLIMSYCNLSLFVFRHASTFLLKHLLCNCFLYFEIILIRGAFDYVEFVGKTIYILRYQKYKIPSVRLSNARLTCKSSQHLV